MFAPFLQKHAVKSPILLRAVSWTLEGGFMEAPRNGEKVSLFIRILAIIFIICGLIAFCSLLFALFERGNVNFDNLGFRDVFGMLSAPYCFLLFLKVAVTGHAPKSWIPWK